MLSLAKLGRENYYLRSVGANASQYYSERGEVAGLWLSGGAAELGLRGRVEDGALLAVLAGYAPDAQRLPDGGWMGERLVAPPTGGPRMPGIDACFKAPKSVSLLWAFGDRLQVGGRRVDGIVESAHDDAVLHALGYLESEAAMGRRGRGAPARSRAAALWPRRSGSGPLGPTIPTCTPTPSSPTCATAWMGAGGRSTAA